MSRRRSSGRAARSPRSATATRGARRPAEATIAWRTKAPPGRRAGRCGGDGECARDDKKRILGVQRGERGADGGGARRRDVVKAAHPAGGFGVFAGQGAFLPFAPGEEDEACAEDEAERFKAEVAGFAREHHDVGEGDDQTAEHEEAREPAAEKGPKRPAIGTGDEQQRDREDRGRGEDSAKGDGQRGEEGSEHGRLSLKLERDKPEADAKASVRWGRPEAPPVEMVSRER